MANDAQREFWNGPAAQVWVDAQQRMDRLLQPLTDIAVGAAALQPHERALDVGCGCGDTTLALARSGAAVHGIDLSEPMIARARERAGGTGNVTFAVDDAATHPYTPDHQLVFSRFGVMFFDDPGAAFAHLRSALADGGRLVFLCWQSPRDNPFMSVAGRAAQPFLPPAERPDPREPGPFAFADRDWVHEILSHAGFTQIRIDPVTPGLTVGRTADESVQLQLRIGPLARALAELDETTRARALAAMRDALAEYATDTGVVLPAGAWLVQARGP